MRLSAILVFGCIAATAAVDKSTDFGMRMVVDAYESVCWYEYLKQFPNTDNSAYQKCGTQSSQIQADALEEADGTEKDYFIKNLSSEMDKLPSDYEECSSLLASATPDYKKASRNDPLKDGGQKNYPFRGFSKCLMKTLEKRHGPQALKAVDDERISGSKSVTGALLERTNQWRALHGVEPLKLLKDLEEAAKEYTSELVMMDCKYKKSNSNHPNRKYKGKKTGEVLDSGNYVAFKFADSGYQIANNWYNEIKDYPFPEGITEENIKVYGKVSRFTQTVWKNTEYVGFAYSEFTDCNNFVTVARYYPTGNTKGGFQENVLPPKE
ncbi:Golgi-associated plant pathogenesis-related protein 1 [Orchesella cincta]|uniref:Golgi-associated plant pathogenesis-related protein 1 n=1 Tax=Orchesella cincta TaxID=48709 RepID=A0A1D2MMS6_ORCCI|nr:Golgi-associated plant pathogenesis-related protein 1 [Orchesella cincta]